jgi:hypothetical protein
MYKEVFNKLSKFIEDIRWINMRNRISFFDYRVQAYLFIYIPKGNELEGDETNREDNSLHHVEIYANSFATDLKKGRLGSAVVLITEIKDGNRITRIANKEEKEYWTNLFNIAHELDRLRGL